MTRKAAKQRKGNKTSKTALGPNVRAGGMLEAWRGTAPAAKAKPARPERVPVAYRLRRDLVERLTRTAWYLQGPPAALRMVDIVERGLEHELARLEREHHGGKPFEAVPAGQRVRGGRRPGQGA